MAVQKHAQLVDAVENLGFAKNMVRALDLAGAAEEFVQGQHGVVARVIGIVAGRPVVRLAALVAHRVIVGDRDRLIVGDEEAELRPRSRSP